jgi:hypothetical protein
MFQRRVVIVAVLACTVLLGVQCSHLRQRSTTPRPTTTTRPTRGTTPPRPSTTTTATTAPAPTTTKATTPPPAPTTTASTRSGGAPVPKPIWRPAPGSALQIQLSGKLDMSIDAPVYEIDGEFNDASAVAALHAKGRKVICYIDGGAAETYRSDYDEMPVSVLGSTVDGWPEERWLDIRQIHLLAPVMEARLDMCKAKGFDAVDPDMLEAYAARTGFAITRQHQLEYNTWLAHSAHARGMAIGMKGNVGQIKELAPVFDFAVNEQCTQYNECESYRPFLDAGKAVFQIEYDVPLSSFCPTAKRLGIHGQRKRMGLDAWRETC